MKQNAYQMDFTDLLKELQTSENWLSNNDAKSRYEMYWPNAIQSKNLEKTIIPIWIQSLYVFL